MVVRFTPGGLQSYDPFQGALTGGTTSGRTQPEPGKSRSQLNCEAKGGRWDESTKKCILPIKKPALPKGTVVTDEDTGKPSGFIDSKGNFVKAGKEDIAVQIRKRQEEASLIGAYPTAGEVRQQQVVEEEQQRFQETGAPVRRELDPVSRVGGDIPVVGPLIVLLADKVRDLLNTPLMKKIVGDSPFGESFELSPEELKTVALTMIEKREIERGLTDSEKFGRLIEAIPGGDLEKFIPGASEAELPSGNVQTALKSLRILKSRAIDVELKYNKGLIKTRSAANARLDQIENEIQEGESRMKMLLQGSPEFKFNSDGVNFIELKILEARERVFDSRMAVMGGPNLDPNEVDILLELQEDVQIEDFDIPGL